MSKRVNLSHIFIFFSHLSSRTVRMPENFERDGIYLRNVNRDCVPKVSLKILSTAFTDNAHTAFIPTENFFPHAVYPNDRVRTDFTGDEERTFFRNTFERSVGNLDWDKKCTSVVLQIFTKLGVPYVNTHKKRRETKGTMFAVDWERFENILSLCALSHPELKDITNQMIQNKE